MSDTLTNFSTEMAGWPFSNRAYSSEGSSFQQKIDLLFRKYVIVTEWVFLLPFFFFLRFVIYGLSSMYIIPALRWSVEEIEAATPALL